ncbi:HlyD family secretion protein [Mesorhizobium sp. CAU 1741]|uniref:HlyD family secretion protein n=1 Tax=Mesorhizobium sp. CAU 1741 TaxID=3140366 RepID=UPI00325AC1A4
MSSTIQPVANANDDQRAPAASPQPLTPPDARAREAAAPSPEPQASPAVDAPPKRRRGRRMVLMLLVPLLLAGGGAYVWATGGRYQETDNANLRQARVSVVADVSGRIVESNVADNAAVKAGDVLFVVDPEPYRIALAQADAALASSRLQVEQLRAALSQAQAKAKTATNDAAYFDEQLARQKDLAGKGVATQASLDAAQRDLLTAQDAQSSADQAVTSALAALGGDATIDTDAHPMVLAALAARDKAAYNLAQTTVTAPADGVVYQAASFQKGQFVSGGAPLFSLVETGDSWIDANFKETQLAHMQEGQTAEVWLDAFPDHAFEATIEAIGAGTGAEFSLLPAQNATGNWVKVTQRIPVRLRLEGDEEGARLRTGMSALVEVDTGHARGLGSLFGTAFAGAAE